MKPESSPTPSRDPLSAGQPVPRKRFRIQKLEERIAPKKGGGTKNCGGSSHTLSTGGGTY